MVIVASAPGIPMATTASAPVIPMGTAASAPISPGGILIDAAPATPDGTSPLYKENNLNNRNNRRKTMNRKIPLAFALFCVLSAAFAGPRAVHARREARHQEKKDDAAEKARRGSHYLTDEGALGPIGWKEYTINPSAKGQSSLVVILNGRESVGDDRRPTEPPPALDPLITFAKTGTKGKMVILVPQVPMNVQKNVGRPPKHGRPDAPTNADKLTELVRSRIEKHGIPSDRVFATGVSAGGHALYGLLVSEPTLFSRALVVSAAGNAEKAGDIKTEIRVYHGANDEVIAPGRAKSMVDAINAKNPGRASIIQLKGKAHRDAAEAAYGKSDCWKWLLQ